MGNKTLNNMIRENKHELHEGLQILELEERFEMVQMIASVASEKQSTRCDVSTSELSQATH